MSRVRATLEREVKLSADERFVLPDLGGEPLAPRRFTSTYHDTEDHRLARAGITLRRREEHGTALWQLKLPRRAARLELEVPGDAAGVPDELARLLLAVVRGRQLQPVATLETSREGVRADGAEVVRDVVTVLEPSEAAGTFTELEVELVDGDERSLRRLEKALRAAGADRGAGRPKLFQALGLEGPAEHTTPAEGNAGGALAAALAGQVRQLLAHDPGTRLGADPEELHQLRVATRRLRAFLRAGRPLVDKSWADALRQELGWLGGALGPVRDLDVMVERFRAEVDRLDGDDEPHGHGLLDVLDREREGAREALVEALESERYVSLLDRLDAVGRPPLVGGDVELAEIWLGEHARLRTAVNALGDDPEDDALHAVRIKVKRARYAAELAGLDEYVTRAKRLQDVLGEHQDAVVAEERLRALAASSPESAVAAGRLVERERRRRERARDGWQTAWRRLARAGKRAG